MKDKMKIAFFTDTYKPQFNGVVTSINAFLEELQRCGHEVHVFAPSGSGKNVHKLPSFNFRLYPGYKIAVPVSEELLLKFRRFGFDIIHVHTPASLGTAAIGLGKHLRIPLVGTFHTLLPEYLHYLGWLMGIKPLQRFAKKGAWKYCTWFHNRLDAVIAPSAHIAKVLKRHGLKRPVFVVPTGIKTEGIMANAGAREKTILHVGRITKEKNIEAIIDALPGLPDTISLRIASDGPHISELKKHAEEKGVARRVKFLGYLSESGLDREYRSAGVFVIASRSETQALVLLEAAMRGLPIVALDAPVTADFVRDNGVGIVSKKSELSKNIMKILGSSKFAGKAASNVEKLKEKYDISRCTEMLLDVYESAARHASTT